MEIFDRPILSIIEKAIQACRHKNAVGFASLFAEDAELILLSGHRLLGKQEIERSTADYFDPIDEIEIEIQQITIEGEQASIAWLWQDISKSTHQRHKAENSIEIDFQAGLIKCWREIKKG